MGDHARKASAAGVTIQPSLRQRLTDRAAQLVAQRQPFVRATVVRAQSPTSARPGDDAIVLSDGSIEGFVGGHCAKESVRAAALATLRDGEAVLLRVLPDDSTVFPETPGARLTINPCLSGGALEIFLEPHVPPAVVEIVGDTPVAEAVAAIADAVGFAVARALPGQVPEGAIAVIVSTHGHDEPECIRAALDAGVGYIGLVASRVRGESVLDAMDLTAAERARIHTPAGVEIGAKTATEIGLSIVAGIVLAVRLEGIVASDAEPIEVLATAVDPICGMSVVVLPTTAHLRVDGVDYWFCSQGCRDHYAAEVGQA
jgi:xanthine dehydrogenase accessory factor